MRYFVVLALVALTGCEEVAPVVSPAMQKLLASCDAGDTKACVTVADLEQRERERRSSIPMPVYTVTPLDPADFRNNPRAPQQCVYNQMGNSVYQNCY